MSRPMDSGPARLRELLVRSIHDLRNPLSVIRASLEWLDVELTGREDVLDAVHDASQATTRILTILEDLDMLSRIESGEAVVAGVVDVGGAIARLASSANVRLESRRVTVAAFTTAPIHVPADVRMLERAIDALVDVCARSASVAAIVELDARVVDVDSGSGFVEISVGLRGTVAAGEGALSIDALASGGIGVYLALRVAEAHAGSLVVQATETVPRVILRLPLA